MMRNGQHNVVREETEGMIAPPPTKRGDTQKSRRAVQIHALRSVGRVAALWLFAMSLAPDVAAPAIARAAESVGEGEASDLLPISLDQHRRLARGEIVSFPVTEINDSEFAVGLAMFVSARVAQLAKFLAAGQLLAQDSTISELGALPDKLPPDALVGPRFTRSERDEIDGLLEAFPGTRFNFSTGEIETFRALRGSAHPPSADIVWDAYRRMLGKRLQAYRQGGLAAMAPYARSGGAVTNPAAELRLAASDADRLARFAPGLREALLRYPLDQPAQLTHRLYWVKRRLQRRPQLSLLDRIVVGGPGALIHIERYFYAGHSYNSSEFITSALAYQDGTLLWSLSRVSTDEVLGLGNELKRSIGRGQLRDEMRKRLERLRAFPSRPVTVKRP